MPIQFICPSCRNPIEIDDEWASQRVACPFCHNTVAAPESSTYAPSGALPTARPFDPHVSGVPPLPGSPAGAAGGNAVAIAGFGLCLAAVAALASFQIYVAPGMTESLKGFETPDEWQRHVQQQLMEGNPPDWAIPGTILILTALTLGLSGLVCGILGLRQVRRRRWAVAGLCMLMLAVPVFCCGGPVGPPVG